MIKTKQKMTPREAVDYLFKNAKRLRLERVMDANHVYECNARGMVCRVCVLGLLDESWRLRGKIPAPVYHKLARRLSEIMGDRHDTFRALRTVPDMRAMRKLFEEALRRD